MTPDAEANKTATGPPTLPPETQEPTPPDSVDRLLEQIDGQLREPHTEAEKEAANELTQGHYREVEELLAGRTTTDLEGNMLGIAYAHLAHDSADERLWQKAADAFLAATELSMKWAYAKATEKVCRAIEDYFGLKAELTFVEPTAVKQAAAEPYRAEPQV